MNISQDIITAHRALSQCSLDLLHYMKEKPGALDRAHYTSLAGMDLNEGPVQSWPLLVDKKAVSQFTEAGVRVFQLIKQVPQRLFSGDIEAMSRYYEIPADEISHSLAGATEEFLKYIVNRGDFIYSPEAGLKCLEPNVSVGIGGWQLSLLPPIYANISMIADFYREKGVKIRKRDLFTALLGNFLEPAVEKFAAHSGEINIAVVSADFNRGVDKYARVEGFLNQAYLDLLEDLPEEPAGEVYFCDKHQLTVKNDSVYFGRKRIHLIIENYHGDVPQPLLDAFIAGNVLLFNGPVTRLLSNKLNLALLSENAESEVFNPEEQGIIKKYIPWTRKIVPGDTVYKGETGDFKELLLARREEMVIKPADRVGGEGVYVGRHIKPSDWPGLVDIAFLQKNWLVQEYLESHPYMFQCGESGAAVHDAVYGLFVFGSRYGGGFVRIMPRVNSKGVLNVSQGASVSPLLEIME